MIGATLDDRYRVEAELGRGGMGAVYRAHDIVLDRPVAVKVLSRSDLGTLGRARLLNEARSAARLAHPNIVAVYDAGESDGQPYIVMQLVEGRSLHEERPETIAKIMAIARQMCAALEHAHAHGIVHRDLKPENVILAADGTAKLMDFGLARSPTSNMTSEGMLVGTVFYLAPEQALGQTVDGRADLYALGVMLYELATGRLPFAGDDLVSVISQHLYSAPVPPRAYRPDLPPPLDELIVRLMAKQPEERPASAGEVIQILDVLENTSRLEAAGLLAASPPPATDRLLLGRLVGRGRELAGAKAAWQRVVAGAPDTPVLLISGESGIGKTRFVRELITLAEISRASVFAGECYPESGTPFAPFAQIIQQALGPPPAPRPSPAGPPEAVREVLSPLIMADLLALAPGLRLHFPAVPANPPLDPLAEQQRLFESVVALCAVLAARAPLLLVVENAHWADGGTLSLLRHLARRARSADLRLLMVLTYREAELAEAHALNDMLADLARERLAGRIKLTRLSRAETEEMLRVMFQEEAPPDFLDRLYQETEGNPYFVEEVCKSLVEAGKLYREGGRWRAVAGVAEMGMPQSLRAAVETRLGRLPPEAQEVLRLAAVIGREFEFELVKQVAAADEEALVNALEAAEQAQVIREVRGRSRETYAFANALLPNVVRESLTGVRRHRLHRRVAAALQALRPDDFASLAFHWGQAGDEEQALAYLVRAADQARRVYASQDAIRFYSEALALLPEDDPARFDLLAARAAVYNLVARRAEQQADVEAMLALAERQNDDARRCDALLALADLYLETDSPRSREPAERAAGIARGMGDRVREGHALRRAGWSAWLRVGHAESRRLLEAAVELFREAGLPGEAAICLHTLSVTLVQLGEFEEALRAAEEAVALSRSAGDRRQEAIGLRRVAIANLSLWRLAEALPCAEAALARHRELGDRSEEANALHVLDGIYAWTGQPEQAYRCLREAYELAEGTGGGPTVALVANSLVTDHFRPRGEFAAGLEFLDGILAKPHLAANKMIDGFVHWLKAMLLIDLGQFAASLETIEAVLPGAERLWGHGFQIFVLSCAGRARAELGQWSQARDVLAAALELAERTGSRFGAGLPLVTLAQTALLNGNPAGLPAGLGQARRAVDLLSTSNLDWADVLVDGWHVQARLHLALAELEPADGHAQAALDCSQRLMQFAERHPTRLVPPQFGYTHSRCLRAVGRGREADETLARACQWVNDVAARTRDEALRRSWLEAVTLNREALAEAKTRGLCA